jgi:hypothetical protein
MLKFNFFLLLRNLLSTYALSYPSRKLMVKEFPFPIGFLFPCPKPDIFVLRFGIKEKKKKKTKSLITFYGSYLLVLGEEMSKDLSRTFQKWAGVCLPPHPPRAPGRERTWQALPATPSPPAPSQV